MTFDSPFNRRRFAGVALGAALAASVVAGLGMAAAQDSAATSDISSAATPPATSDRSGRENDELDVTAMIDQATTMVSEVSTDRDAVSVQIDTATVDDLLAHASDLIGRAQATSASDANQPVRLLSGAVATAEAAHELLEARLTYAGLPSQEGRASRTLAAAYEQIDAVSGPSSSTSDVDTSFYVTTAQALYGEAFDLYGAGSFNQASETAATAARIAATGGFLAGSSSWPDEGMRGSRGMPGFGGEPGRHADMRQPAGPHRNGNETTGDPVTVPDSTF